MTLAIHDQGGLTEAEIKLAIEEAAERREAALETKLASHRAEMREDLAETHRKIEDTNKTVTKMQRELGSLAAETGHQTEKLEAILRNGEEWHQADLEFRADMLTRVSKIEIDQTVLTVAVARLKWFGVTCYYAGRALRFSVDKAKEADVWKVIATLGLFYLLKLASPALAHVLEKAIAK